MSLKTLAAFLARLTASATPCDIWGCASQLVSKFTVLFDSDVRVLETERDWTAMILKRKTAMDHWLTETHIIAVRCDEV